MLRRGSKGEEVKELQKFLGIPADGIFGPRTEKSVKEWQSKNGLVVDGIVGPSTRNRMGFISTDSNETVQKTKNGLVVHKHYLPPHEYFKGPTKKEYIFLHHTAGWNNPYNTINNWGRDNRGRIATEYVIGGQSIRGNDDKFDGEVVKAFPIGGYAWHLGGNGSHYMHTHSIGIEICNFGQLTDGKTYVGTLADKSQTVKLKKPFRGFSEWHRYSDNQIESTRKLLLHLADRDNIDIREGLPKLIKEVGVKAFDFNQDMYEGKIKGVISHTNTRRDKFDIFPQQEMLDMLTSL